MDNGRRKLIGSILWWTEGTKSRKDKRWKNSWTYAVEITNTNPAIIKLFLDFLRHDIGVEEPKLKVQLQVHEGDDQAGLEAYWSSITDIPKERFTKTIVRPKGNKVGRSKGTCKIRYCDKQTYIRLSNMLNDTLRGVAQLASASALGAEGPGFESRHPDQLS